MNDSERYADYHRPIAATVDDTLLTVTLADGRVISTPLAWYPRLQAATLDQRNHIELMTDGLHFPELDEDLSIKGMLAGNPAWSARNTIAER